MKDPELRAAEEEVREAQRKVLAAHMEKWEERGPQWWWRVAVLVCTAGLGYALTLAVFLLREGVVWQKLLSPALIASLPLFLRLLPPTNRLLRRFDTELLLGLVVGVVLAVLFVLFLY
ncbi:hypothetical protein V3W47_14435 [Deinococcus sp. YIM 134068]|uniref:hypothetical protein n=1 Tax=Deinococcus lichenicola TaxID=3118910 RepID=UPI002F9373F1